MKLKLCLERPESVTMVWKSELEVLDFNSHKCLEELQKMYPLATNSISKALLNHTVKGISFLSDDITSVQDLHSAT